MWVCRACGTTFSTPDSVTNIFDEHIDVCPYCGSKQIKEVSRCKICGRPTETLTADYCTRCIDAASVGFNRYMEALAAEICTEKIELMEDLTLAMLEG